MVNHTATSANPLFMLLLSFCDFTNFHLVMQPPPKVSFDGLPFCDYIPQSITSLARNKKGLIAASRLNGSIDIYDENDSFYLIHHLPSWSLTSIESVCWESDRLFATGGEGRIFELQLLSIRPKVG